ncbi:MAG: formylglycine-generating enzyme family protein, partial [Rivularia sp. (in: cyanobacteria)]
DMHGNVWEWCQDTCHRNYEGSPSDGSAWLNNVSSPRILRGGSWYVVPGNCRSTFRYHATRILRDIDIGIRLVLFS